MTSLMFFIFVMPVNSWISEEFYTQFHLIQTDKRSKFGLQNLTNQGLQCMLKCKDLVSLNLTL